MPLRGDVEIVNVPFQNAPQQNFRGRVPKRLSRGVIEAAVFGVDRFHAQIPEEGHVDLAEIGALEDHQLDAVVVQELPQICPVPRG